MKAQSLELLDCGFGAEWSYVWATFLTLWGRSALRRAKKQMAKKSLATKMSLWRVGQQQNDQQRHLDYTVIYPAWVVWLTSWTVQLFLKLESPCCYDKAVFISHKVSPNGIHCRYHTTTDIVCGRMNLVAIFLELIRQGSWGTIVKVPVTSSKGEVCGQVVHRGKPLPKSTSWMNEIISWIVLWPCCGMSIARNCRRRWCVVGRQEGVHCPQ